MRFSSVVSVVVGLLMLVVAGPLSAEEIEVEKTSNSILANYDRGFRFSTRDNTFALRMNGLLQVRWTYVDYDPTTRFNQEDYSNFFVRRARLYFSGHAGNPKFTYLFHVQLEPSQGLNANDLWFEYQFSDLLRLGAGRNKISYGLEMLNSGSALGMVERSVMYGETDIDLGSAALPGPRFPVAEQARGRSLASDARVRRRSRCHHLWRGGAHRQGPKPGRLPSSRNGAARLLVLSFKLLVLSYITRFSHRSAEHLRWITKN